MGKGEDLTSTFVRGARGSLEEVKLGDDLYLVNPQILDHPTERRSQESMNKKLPNEIGNPPYVLLRITKYPAVTLVDIEGEKGIKEGLTKAYFTI
jgi:hypothetical protein